MRCLRENEGGILYMSLAKTKRLSSLSGLTSSTLETRTLPYLRLLVEWQRSTLAIYTQELHSILLVGRRLLKAVADCPQE